MNAFQEWLAQRGSVAKLARGLKRTHSAVRQWKGRVPAEMVVEAEQISGVPREAIRPDLYRGLSRGAANAPAEQAA